MATHSAHWIADPDFAAVIARYLDHERRLVTVDIAEQTAAGPFRQDLASPSCSPMGNPHLQKS